MSAKKIQLSKNGVLMYPQTIDQAVAVVAKGKLLSTVLAELGAEDERLAGLIAAAEAKITTLNGTGEGSVDKKIADAIDEFATQVTDNGTIDTVKELFDYVATHGSEFNALLERVTVVEGKVTTLEGDNATNKADIAQLKTDVATNTSGISSLNGKVGSSADEANGEGSLYARIAQLKADLAALSGDGGTVSEQINAAIEANNVTINASIKEAKDAADAAQTHSEGVASNLSEHISDTVKHVTAAEREAWNAKIDYAEVGTDTYPDFDEIVSAEA